MKTVVARLYPDSVRVLKNGAKFMNKTEKTRRYGIADAAAKNIEAVALMKHRIKYLELRLLQLPSSPNH